MAADLTMTSQRQELMSSTNAQPAWLKTEHLSVHFGDRSALEDVTVAFPPGQTVGLVGPNGAGKSTLLRVLGGALPPSHGSVLLDGEPLRGPDPRLVSIPQRTSVDWTFPISVLDVVLMARRQKRSRFLPYGRADRAAALGALRQVGMERYAGVQIGQLSGGQQQRVFIARALLDGGDIYLLDEPFTGVDIPTQQLVASLLTQLADEGRTIIYATHDLQQAQEISDQILILNRKVIAYGPPAEVMTTQHLLAGFGGLAVLPAAERAMAG